MPCTIRDAAPADVPELVEIIRTAFRDVALRFDLTPENCPRHPSNCHQSWIEDALGKGVRYFILDAEGGSCGCVALEQASSETCYLERLAVLPTHRRRGYGRALVVHALAEARPLGSRGSRSASSLRKPSCGTGTGSSGLSIRRRPASPICRFRSSFPGSLCENDREHPACHSANLVPA